MSPQPVVRGLPAPFTVHPQPPPPLACRSALVVPALMRCLLLCDTVDTGENPGIKLLADDEETVLTHASFWRTILSPVRYPLCHPLPSCRRT